MAGSGTQEKPKKYKGYEVRKDPMPTMKIGDMFNSEKRNEKCIQQKTILQVIYADKVRQYC
jgi:hypothetical protein